MTKTASVPPALVDETAPVVELEADTRTVKRGEWTITWYLGPKLPASWNKPHPKSYGAHLPFRHPTGCAPVQHGAKHLHKLEDSPAIFGPCGTVLCGTCHGSGLVRQNCGAAGCTDRSHLPPFHKNACHFVPCSACEGTGRKATTP